MLLADLGFKKIYLASARTLVNSVPLWSKQRPCNEVIRFPKVDSVMCRCALSGRLPHVTWWRMRANVKTAADATVICVLPWG